MSDTTKTFTRAQIYDIRRRGDAGESAPSIRRDYPDRGVETIRRVIRRDTYAEIGVGASERSMVSNRMEGEKRRTGDPIVPFHSVEAPVVEDGYSRQVRHAQEQMLAQGGIPREPDPLEVFASFGRLPPSKPPRDAYDLDALDDPEKPDGEASLRIAEQIAQAVTAGEREAALDGDALLEEMTQPANAGGSPSAQSTLPTKEAQ